MGLTKAFLIIFIIISLINAIYNSFKQKLGHFLFALIIIIFAIFFILVFGYFSSSITKKVSDNLKMEAKECSKISGEIS